MLKWITPRIWNYCVVICCALLFSFAMYSQYVDYLDPCPLCALQRFAFLLMGVFALLGAIHNPERTGQRIYAWLVATGAAFGAVIAGRHVWLQNLPLEEVPECGPGLNYMLENFPISETISTIFYGSGGCAEILWVFLGMTMPMWTFTWYVGLGLVGLWVVYRSTRLLAKGIEN